MTPTISLHIATYNRPDLLALVLARVAELRPQPTEIVICDDGSTSDTAAVVKRFAQESPTDVKHSYQPDDGWQLSRSMNLGVSRSTGDYLLFLEGDCLVQRSFVSDHLAMAKPRQLTFGDRVHVDPGMAPTLRLSLPGKLRLLTKRRLVRKRCCIFAATAPGSRHALRTSISGTDDIPFVIGCNMGCFRADFMALKGFDEAFDGSWGGADVDLALRALNQGMTLLGTSRRATVFHVDHKINIDESAAAKYAGIDAKYRSGVALPEKSLLLEQGTGKPPCTPGAVIL